VQNLRGNHRHFGPGKATTGPFCIASKTSQKTQKKKKKKEEEEKKKKENSMLFFYILKKSFLNLKFI
jgi:hypothetical protein